MDDSRKEYEQTCPLIICLFLLRAGAAIGAGIIMETALFFGLIPVAFIMNYNLLCMTNSKVAKSRCGLQYWISSIGYHAFWIFAIVSWKDDMCYEGGVTAVHRIYFCLTINMLLDFWMNRRWLMKMGRKYCLSEETRMEFKRIKASKKQMK